MRGSGLIASFFCARIGEDVPGETGWAPPEWSDAQVETGTLLDIGQSRNRWAVCPGLATYCFTGFSDWSLVNVCQSLRKFSMPLSVKGCLVDFSSTS